MDDSQPSGVVSEDETKITLGLLNAVEANSALTQRSMASELGIALGLANAYLKRCVRKGLIKVQQVPANRYAYYLTPMGFAEKSRLTADYLAISFNFFRRARSECAVAMQECKSHGWQRVALAGVGDLGEIALLCAADGDVQIIGFIDPDYDGKQFMGLPVVNRPDRLELFDAILVTDFQNPQMVFDALIKSVPSERVVSPEMLSISRQRPTLME